MVIDPANLTHTNLQSKAEREVTPDVAKVNNVNNDGIPEAGQTSEIGPAVVTNISQATLETSRAINAPEQNAEDSRADDIVEAQEKGKLDRLQDAQQTAAATPPRSKPLIDKTI